VVDVTGVERWSLRLARLGLAVIAVVTFITSFDAVSAVGAARGAVSAELAWAIPLALDGLIVVGSAVAWLESLRGGRWHPFPVTLVAVAGALSVAANVAHASGTDPLARALAAVPPVALLAAVELGAWQLRREANRTEQAAGDHAVTAGTDLSQPVTGVRVEADDLPEVTDELPVTERARLVVAAYLSGGGDIDARGLAHAVAERAGCHRRTAYRVIRDAQPAAVAASTNGQRPEPVE
jgi:hypothetical protein